MKFFKTIAVLAALLLVSTIGFAQQKKVVKSVTKSEVQKQNKTTVKTNSTQGKVVATASMQRIDDPTLNATIITYERARVGRIISKELLGIYSSVDKNYAKNVVLEGENFVDYNNIFTIEAAKKKGKIIDSYDVKAYAEKQKTSNVKLSTAEEKLLQMKLNEELQTVTPPVQVENNVFGNE